MRTYSMNCRTIFVLGILCTYNAISTVYYVTVIHGNLVAIVNSCSLVDRGSIPDSLLQCLNRFWGRTILLSSGYWWSFFGISRPRREADYSPPSNADVNYLWSYASTPLYACIAWCLIKLGMPFDIDDLLRYRYEFNVSIY